MLVCDNSRCTIEWVCTEDGFDQLESDWSRLHSLNANNGLFSTWHWNRLWWQHYGDIGSLSILLVRIDGQIEALAPFYVSNTTALRLKTVRTLRFIGSGGDTSPDDLDVLCNPVHPQAVLATVVAQIFNRDGLDRIQMRDVSGNSAFLQVFIACAAESSWAVSNESHLKRRVDTLPGSIAEYESTLSRNSRKKRKKRRRQLQQAGSHCFHQCTTPAEVSSTLDELSRLHVARHASKGISGSFSSARYLEFHSALMLKALNRGELRLVSLSVEDRLIGVEYAFVFNQCLMFFQSGFDPEFEHLSPGHLLMMHMIDNAIIEGARSVDLLKGDYAYKSSYAKAFKVSSHVDAFRSQALARACRSLVSLRCGVNALLSGMDSSKIRKHGDSGSIIK